MSAPRADPLSSVRRCVFLSEFVFTSHSVRTSGAPLTMTVDTNARIHMHGTQLRPAPHRCRRRRWHHGTCHPTPILMAHPAQPPQSLHRSTPHPRLPPVRSVRVCCPPRFLVRVGGTSLMMSTRLRWMRMRMSTRKRRERSGCYNRSDRTDRRRQKRQQTSWTSNGTHILRLSQRVSGSRACERFSVRAVLIFIQVVLKFDFT